MNISSHDGELLDQLPEPEPYDPIKFKYNDPDAVKYLDEFGKNRQT